MSTVLATLSAASMRLGQPIYVDISQRMGDIVLTTSVESYKRWVDGLDAEPYGEDQSDSTLNVVEYATKTIGPDHWTFTIRSAY